MSKYYQCAVDFPKKESVFTYSSSIEFSRGDLVEVPFGRRSAKATVLGEIDTTDLDKVKDIKEKMQGSFSLSENELKLYEWMSKYYHYSLGKLVFDCLPKILKRPRKTMLKKGEANELPFQLNSEQNSVVQGVLNEGDKFSQHYIHGVTGSGKSAVYVELIKAKLREGKSVQFLIPEINLTPQFTQMFESFLGCKILAYHSAITPSEKYTIWKELKETTEPVLVMGVRSSIFLPIKDLGLVIVDEEHDSSFKQTDRCPYNGRDVAIKKAHIENVPVILGSATPTMENFYNFSTMASNRFYYELKNRAASSFFPTLKILDERGKFSEVDEAYPFLDETLDEIKSRLEKKEQVLVFINKLGYSNYLQCRNCGHQFYNDKCGCQNNLRYFKSKNCLSCSHCDFVMKAPDQCPECASISLLNRGFGTEKVEQVLKGIFNEYVIERFDRDEIKSTKQLNDKLNRFHNQEIDIFVGTQMLAKGHNFKKVNLVVILGVDSMLNYSDFRSNEKTYQLVEQISGRAGRYHSDSNVIIQTKTPEHPVFKFIQDHSFNEFYKEELPLRELCQCPPFTKLVMIYFSSRFKEALVPEITQVANSLRAVTEKNNLNVSLLGPAPMSIEKKANQFTWGIMLKSSNIMELHKTVETFEINYKAKSNISFKVDIDPIQIL